MEYFYYYVRHLSHTSYNCLKGVPEDWDVAAFKALPTIRWLLATMKMSIFVMYSLCKINSRNELTLK